MPPPIAKEELRELVLAQGVDLARFAAVAGLEETVAEDHRPSTLAADAKTFIVFAKKTLRGVTMARHLPSKQLAGGRNLRILDHAAESVARWLEERQYLALPTPSTALDFARRGPLDLTPAGQGSTLLRHAAVAAGLGTWGLNLMVLTPSFGPRVHLSGVLTTLEVEPDPVLDQEICLGLEECGRCAAICPEDAIPRRAMAGAPTESVRGLDSAACARSCQPFGFQNFEDHLVHIFESTEGKEMWGRMRSRKSGEIWTEMAMMKEAAFTGCSECVQVCPVGEDWEALRDTHHRRSDLPETLPRKIADGWVEVESLGPQVRRNTTWDREARK